MKMIGNFYHYIDLSKILLSVPFSERELSSKVGISKTEINRLLNIARMDEETLQAAKKYSVEKWALFEITRTTNPKLKKILIKKLSDGELVTRSDVKNVITYFFEGKK